MVRKAKRILIPLYGTIRPSKAHEVALKRLEAGGKLILFHVVDYAPVKLLRTGSGQMGEKGGVVESYKENLKSTQRRKVEEFVEEIKPQAEDEGVELETVYTEGNPAEEIVKVAEERDIDLIVMERLREEVTNVFFGSVSDHVEENVPCEVLTAFED